MRDLDQLELALSGVVDPIVVNSGKSPKKTFLSARLIPLLVKDAPVEFSLALGVSTAILGFLPIALMILGVEPSLDITPFIQSTILDAPDFRPEPQERMLYLAGLVYFPVALFLWRFAERRIVLPATTASTRIAITWVLLIPALCLLLPITAYFSSPGTWNKSAYAVLGMTEFGLPTWIHLVTVLSVLAVVFKLHSRILVDLICIGLALLLSVMTVLGENDPQAVSIHLQVLMSPLVQIMHGNTLLVGMTSQYGLFPQMLAPLFELVGLSITSFTLVMSGLSLLSLVLLYVAMRRLLDSTLILLIGYTSLLAFACVWGRYMGLNELGLDPYFQYWPVRSLFPALAIFMIVQHDRYPTRGGVYLGHFLFSLGCLWNLDSGVPAWGAWVAYLLFRAGDRKLFFKEGVRATSVLLFTFAGYFLYLYLRAGAWPSPQLMIESHRVFAYAGYYLLPAVILHPWNLVVIGYLVAMGWSIRRWQEGACGRVSEKQGDDAIVFSLAILGCGLLSYYVGRSHDLVFPETAYPVFILAMIFLDRLSKNRASAGPLARFLGLFVVGLFLILAVGQVGKLTALSDVALQRLALMSSPRMERTTQVLDLVAEHRMHHRSIVFLSDHATYWHVLTGIGAATPDNLNVMFYQSEVDELGAVIALGEVPVFVDSYFPLPREGKTGLVHEKLLAILKDSGYQAHTYTQDRSFSYWRPPDQQVRP